MAAGGGGTERNGTGRNGTERNGGTREPGGAPGPLLAPPGAGRRRWAHAGRALVPGRAASPRIAAQSPGLAAPRSGHSAGHSPGAAGGGCGLLPRLGSPLSFTQLFLSTYFSIPLPSYSSCLPVFFLLLHLFFHLFLPLFPTYFPANFSPLPHQFLPPSSPIFSSSSPISPPIFLFFLSSFSIYFPSSPPIYLDHLFLILPYFSSPPTSPSPSPPILHPLLFPPHLPTYSPYPSISPLTYTPLSPPFPFQKAPHPSREIPQETIPFKLLHSVALILPPQPPRKGEVFLWDAGGTCSAPHWDFLTLKYLSAALETRSKRTSGLFDLELHEAPSGKVLFFLLLGTRFVGMG